MPHFRPAHCLGGLVFMIGWAIASVTTAAVDPADITPVANLLGGLMAVAGARLVAALCVMLAALSLARSQGGLCLFLVMLAGIVLVAPVLIKAVVTHVAVTGGS
ncbi:MAG: hypothetical protein HOP18_19415 [Deltaproteobacteria bacterium]|nr:hypothetical protein [Deltaproteobacteria bacterium]